MTRNNLNEHLQWLLSGRQSASTVPVPDYQVLEISRAEEGLQHPESTALCSDGTPQELEAPATSNVTRATQSLRQPHPQSQKDLSSLELRGDMARLQSEPRVLKKSQMPSRDSPTNQQLPTPALSTPRGKQLARGNGAAGESPSNVNNSIAGSHREISPSNNSPKKTQETSRKSHKMPRDTTFKSSEPLANRAEKVDIFDEETEFKEKDVTTPAKLSRGRKRKSSELESDSALGRTDHASKLQFQGLHSPFVAIDDYLADNPPPYSTNPAPSNRSLARFDQADRLQTSQSPYKDSRAGGVHREMPNILPASSPTSCSPVLRRRSAPFNTAKAPMLQYSLDRKATSFNERWQEPGSMTAFSIADSEEEDDEEHTAGHQAVSHDTTENADKFSSQENSKFGGVSYPKLPKSTAELLRRSNIESRSREPRRSPQRRAAMDETTTLSHQPSVPLVSPFHRDSPTKATLAKIVDPMPNLAPCSHSQQDQQEKLSMLLDATSEQFHAMLEFLNSEEKSSAEAQLEILMAGKDVPGHIIEKVVMFKAAIKSLQAIMPLCNHYQRSNFRVQELRQRSVTAIRENPLHGYVETVAELKRVTHKLQEVKDEILCLSEEANLFLYLKDFGHLPVDSAQPRDNPRIIESQAPVSSLQAHRSPFNAAQDNSLVKSPGSQPPQYVHRSSQTPRDTRPTNTLCLAPMQRQKRKDVLEHEEPHPPVEMCSPDKGSLVVEGFNNTSLSRINRQYQSISTPGQTPHIDQNLQVVHGEYDDGVTFNMGSGESPPCNMPENDEYPFEEDDEAFLEAYDELYKPSNPKLSPSPSYHTHVLIETAGNSIRPPKKHTTPKLSPNQMHSSQMQHRWSRDVKTAMKDRFHLKGFRLNQLEAINATLEGKDAFVLMPTGGGKSLCYQLPSVVQSGNTKGVTIVISPLLSLMQDQIEHLRKLKIQARMINGESAAEDRRVVLDMLKEHQVEKSIQLLYITPEMINKSQTVLNALRALHARGKLARLVIDEAHCVSQWGHDFRPDYKLLGEVRQQFQKVPVMALTATATENVKFDTIQNLGIAGCAVFTQSFNRPNLTYEVRGKSKTILENIAELIHDRYRHQSGIIYCLSRKNCETVAKRLRENHGIKAEHYHAGMTSEKKMEVQESWQAGSHHVIVATIAFGMGIDKPDVRFVIHHSIPKSLEGYYQETGRAGRDTKRSGCYLYYGYQDISALKRMIDTGDGNYEQKDRQRNMLRRITQFCENRSDCRRVQVLGYFNEEFKSQDCHGTCDNCLSNDTFENRDLTNHAVDALNLVKEIQENGITLINCVDILWGGKNQKTAPYTKGKYFGSASVLTRGDVERIFYRLLGEDALVEESVMNNAGFPVQYIGLGSKCEDYLKKSRRFFLQVRVSDDNLRGENAKRAKTKARAKSKPATGVTDTRKRVYPLSTNVSSPVQAGTRGKRRRIVEENDSDDLEGFVVDDEEDETYIGSGDAHSGKEAFEPIRVAGKQRHSRGRQLGPPIRKDDRLQGLSEMHQHVIEGFLCHARHIRQGIMVKHSLRDQPFTDNMLREMAISFPKDQSEMRTIQGIDPDRVKRYAKDFFPLIKSTQERYNDMLRDTEIPQDPNHRNVIELSDSDDDEDHQFDDPDFDEWVENDVGPTDQSPFFRPEPDVEAFNARGSGPAGTAMPPSRAPAETSDSRGKSNSRGPFNGYKKFRKGAFRKKGSGGGVFKKGRAKEKRTSSESMGGKRKNYNNTFWGGGGGGSGSIGMMPT